MKQVYEWKREPEAEKLVLDLVNECKSKSSFIAHLDTSLAHKTSTRLFDWVDYVAVNQSQKILNNLESTGFKEYAAGEDYRAFYHSGAQLPKVVVKDQTPFSLDLALKVESIPFFLMVHGIGGEIEGSPFSPFRRAKVTHENGISLFVVERRSTLSMDPVTSRPGYLENYIQCKEKWMRRPRALKNDDLAMDETINLAEELVSELGRDLAAWIVMECEREYWQSKNQAAQIQKNRQDSVGMGWANHDHHTFRSSRKHFTKLVRLLEILGFHCRERFYAGKEAGWGAQVVENPKAGLVCFLDLDLQDDELSGDFAHEKLSDTKKLGTIGLWCALHGDSILQAGMHHLEAQFAFDALKGDLEKRGISMMDPFSNFDYLKQAFTHGEVWPVDPDRIDTLLSQNKISSAEAEKFLKYGAVGSHLENLQRNEGYKGFNQKNVSFIIAKTDPRALSL